MLKKTRLSVLGSDCTAFVMSDTMGFTEISREITAIFERVKLIVGEKAINKETSLYSETNCVPLHDGAGVQGREVGWDVNTLSASINNTEYPSTLTASSATKVKKEAKDMNICLIVKVIDDPYWKVLVQGAKDMAAELGILPKNLIIVGIAYESEVEKQIELLQNAVLANMDAIIVAPTNSTSMAGDVSRAFKSGIPVICVDTKINTEDYTAALMTNNVEAGKAAAKEMIKRWKENGISETEEAQVAIQVGSAASQTIIDRLDGFIDYWNANAPGAWEILTEDIKVNDGDIAKALVFAEEYLTTYPDLRGFFGSNSESTAAFCTAMEESNRTDITIVGFDFSPEMADMVEVGEFSACAIAQNQYFMGYESVKLAVDAAQGKPIAKKNIDIDILVIDKKNVGTKEVQAIINPSGR